MAGAFHGWPLVMAGNRVGFDDRIRPLPAAWVSTIPCDPCPPPHRDARCRTYGKIRSVPDFTKEKRMLKSRRLLVRTAVALALAASTASSAHAEIVTYEADKAHSNI